VCIPTHHHCHGSLARRFILLCSQCSHPLMGCSLASPASPRVVCACAAAGWLSLWPPHHCSLCKMRRQDMRNGSVRQIKSTPELAGGQMPQAMIHLPTFLQHHIHLASLGFCTSCYSLCLNCIDQLWLPAPNSYHKRYSLVSAHLQPPCRPLPKRFGTPTNKLIQPSSPSLRSALLPPRLSFNRSYQHDLQQLEQRHAAVRQEGHCPICPVSPPGWLLCCAEALPLTATAVLFSDVWNTDQGTGRQ
jgi:hypothetical protein